MAQLRHGGRRRRTGVRAEQAEEENADHRDAEHGAHLLHGRQRAGRGA
jgi:hypothetical protein